jgi:hypothetical protein
MKIIIELWPLLPEEKLVWKSVPAVGILVGFLGALVDWQVTGLALAPDGASAKYYGSVENDSPR